MYLGRVHVDSPKLDEQVKGGGESDFFEVPIRVLDLETETVVLRSGRWQTAEILMKFFGSNI